VIEAVEAVEAVAALLLFTVEELFPSAVAVAAGPGVAEDELGVASSVQRDKVVAVRTNDWSGGQAKKTTSGDSTAV
jgi:hypothetical protein